MKRRNFFKGLGALAGIAVLPKGDLPEKVDEIIPTKVTMHTGTSSGGTVDVKYAQVYSTVDVDKKTALNFDKIVEATRKHYIKKLSEDVFDSSELTKNILSKGK